MVNLEDTDDHSHNLYKSDLVGNIQYHILYNLYIYPDIHRKYMYHTLHNHRPLFVG